MREVEDIMNILLSNLFYKVINTNKMGFSFSKDKNIDIYMHTNKQYYVSGQYVKGQIYLNVKTSRVYSKLLIKLSGQEYVSWTTGSGQNQSSISKKLNNYQAQSIIKDFGGLVQQGQYVFPFSLLLPAMITGSFYYSGFCYLKYTLRAELEHLTSKSDSQYYEMFLNIIEPPRFNVGPASITNHVNAQCCKCCIDYGVTSVTLRSDKNFVLNGDQINLSCVIDNTRGKEPVEAFNITLEEHRSMIASDYEKQDIKDKQYNLVRSDQSIPKGGNSTFNFKCKIPNDITSYTAIGRIVARYFFIHLNTEYGCCANTPQAMLHIIVHSRRPQIVQKKKIKPPENWNPRVQAEVIFANLPPYIYNPQAQIPFLNMPSRQEISMDRNNGALRYPPRNIVYDNTGMNVSDERNLSEYGIYEPMYYNPNMFSEAERQQQGYQPYFNQA